MRAGIRSWALAALLALLGVPSPGVASPTPRASAVPAQDDAPDRIILRTLDVDWRHEQQRAWPPTEFSYEERIEIRDVSSVPGVDFRVFELTIWNVEARETVGPRGALRSLQVETPRLGYTVEGPRAASSTPRSRLQRLRADRGVLILPSGRFRDLRVPLPPGQLLRAGDRWTDTLAFIDAPGEGLEERYHEVRTFTVAEVTVIDDRPALWLDVEGTVEYEIDDALMFWPASIERTYRRVRGTTAGRVAVDAWDGLRMAGADTAHWAGEAVLDDPVAGALTSPVAVTRVRGWRHFEPDDYTAYRDSARAEQRRTSGGMVGLPGTDIEVRLRTGDLALADSLVRLAEVAPTTDSATMLLGHLRWIVGHGSWTSASVDSMSWAAAEVRGDTAWMVGLARSESSGSLSPAQVRFLASYLDDPQRMWRAGDPPRDVYRSLASTLLRSSPLTQTDTARWECRPRTCEVWLAHYDSANDPRLRDAALVGRFAREPARWYSELAARAEAGSDIVEGAMRYAEGQSDVDRPPLPADPDDWRAWADWWRLPGPFGGSPGALRVHRAVTGRDPLATWIERWPPANDTARMVMEPILRSFGHLAELTVDEVHARFLARDNPHLPYFGGALGWIEERGDTLSSADAAPFLVPALAARLEQAELPWSEWNPRPPRPNRRPVTTQDTTTPVPRFLVETYIPPELLGNLPPDVSTLSAAEFRGFDPRAGASLLSFAPTLRLGPFVRLSWSWRYQRARPRNTPPSAFGGGGTLVLMDSPEGWVILTRSGWIT